MKHNLSKKIIIDSNNKPIREYLKDPYKNMSIKSSKDIRHKLSKQHLGLNILNIAKAYLKAP